MRVAACWYALQTISCKPNSDVSRLKPYSVTADIALVVLETRFTRKRLIACATEEFLFFFVDFQNVVLQIVIGSKCL